MPAWRISANGLRSDLVRTINLALDGLTAEGVGLGIEILRVDVQSKLPEEAISAFEEVLTATQSADQEIASAQTTAAYTSQEGAQAADRTLQLAQAQASERLSKSESATIGLQQLEKTLNRAHRTGSHDESVSRTHQRHSRQSRLDHLG